MLGPGFLVIGMPLLFGFFLGEKSLMGLLPGMIVSSVQLAISAANSGGAWDNAKKFFESKRMKGTEEHKVLFFYLGISYWRYCRWSIKRY